ncbi:MAG TPA: MBL fold metallo-hydrolase [Thermohalobaculum sp.]|nr:MBL fold metallo-hydrolase [Thermohalobaculum sp.]
MIRPVMERARPEDWYRLRTMGDGVTLIDEPWIREYYRCNIWHLRGRDRDLLVDTGMGVVSLRQWVPLVTERPLTAVASHTHYDHIGSHHEFPDRVAHACEAGLLAEPTREATLAEYVREENFERLPPAPFQAGTYAVKRAPATRIVADGDVIDLGDRHFEVIHTPGHSPGGIALWEAATGILFSGDILYDGPLAEDLYHSDPVDYLASMKRLLELPVRVVHAGHFASFGADRHRAIIRAWLDEREGAGG